MISYGGQGKPVRRQSSVPAPPFFARTWISPYSPLARSSWSPSIDHYTLTGAASNTSFSASELSGPIEGKSPIFLDLTGPQEMVFRVGESVTLPAANGVAMFTAESGIPRVGGDPFLLLSAWPLWFEEIESMAARMSEQGSAWGLFVPLMVPTTTAISVLDRLCEIARVNGAQMVAGEQIALSGAARRALLDRFDHVDSETWSTAYDESDQQLVSLSASRHLAARARDGGMRWWVEPTSRDNWGAASHLVRIGAQMDQLGRSPELAADFSRAALAIISLGHDVGLVAGKASLTIVENVSDLADQCVMEWLERGSSEIADEIDDEWCLAREVR